MPTITGNITDLTGAPFSTRGVRLALECSDRLIPDGTGGRLAAQVQASIDEAGDFTFTDVQATVGGAPLYRLSVQGHRGGPGASTSTGWFELTTDRDLGWIIANSVQPSMVTPDLVQNVADNAAAVLAVVATNDGIMAAVDADPESAYRQQSDARHSATYATQAGVAAAYVSINEPPLSPLRYGFVGDGSTDDTTALQDTINALPTGGEMVLPHSGNAKITAPLTIDQALTIRGRSGRTQRIFAVGCSGIQIAAGTDNVTLQDFEVAAGTRHTTSANTFVGVEIDGTTGNHSTDHVLRNVFCDGFETGFRVRYCWSSKFDGIQTVHGKNGLMAYGKSVNNWIGGWSRLITGGGSTATAVAGSIAIGLIGRESATDTTAVASEGWVIGDTLAAYADQAIDLVGYNHVYMRSLILDFCQKYGVRLQATGATFSNNVSLSDSYIAFSGTSATAAVSLGNVTSNVQRRHARIGRNEFTVYSGGSCSYGVFVGAEGRAIISDNASTGFATSDIRDSSSAGNIIYGNACLSSGVTNNNIWASATTKVGGNVGTVNGGTAW